MLQILKYTYTEYSISFCIMLHEDIFPTTLLTTNLGQMNRVGCGCGGNVARQTNSLEINVEHMGCGE